MLRVGQAPRIHPLTPCAALALGPSTLAFLARLLQLPEPRLLRLRGVAGRDFLLALGSAEDLPWCDGLHYLGREPGTPELLLPCAETSNVPPTLLLRALSERFKSENLRAPFAVSFEPALVVPVADAQPLSQSLLGSWQSGGLAS
jgi:hypothetical protein